MLHLTGAQRRHLCQACIWLRGEGELTRKQLRRGVFKSVDQRKAAIQSFVDQHNENPKGFRWTKTAQQILTKVERARRSLQTLDKPPSV